MSWDAQEAVRNVVLAVFWLWFLARLANDWLGGLVVPAGEPFVPPELFAAASDALLAAATGLGVVGVPLAWLGNALESVAFALTYLPHLASGMWVTVLLTAAGIALGFLLAVPLAAFRVYGGATRWFALGVIELIRGTPLLAQLFVLYYALPLSRWFARAPLVGVGPIPAQAVWVAVVGFTINSSAYQAEYFRGAIEGVDPGQLTAARSVGLSKVEGVRYVVLPQALRYAIPSWTNELVYLVKYSSLASIITVTELFRAAEQVAYENYRFFDLFLLAGVLYVLLVLSATTTMEWVRKQVAIPGVGTGSRR